MKYCSWVFILISTSCFTQIDEFKYSQKLLDITDTYHKIVIPQYLFENVKDDFSDIRIYGIGTKADTIEVPYFLKVDSENDQRVKLPGKVIDKSFTSEGYYYTIKFNGEPLINRMYVEFESTNFNKLLRLEGSYDQKKWFTINDSNRVVAIENEMTNYNFSTLSFDDVKFLYYRIFVPDSIDLGIKGVYSYLFSSSNTPLIEYELKEFHSNIDPSKKQTVVDFDLEKRVPLSELEVSVLDTFDFYRNINLQIVSDSTQSEEGWKYHYSTIYRGVLSSLNEQTLKIRDNKSSKFRLIIYNLDNEPLNIDMVTAKGRQHEIICRFTKPGEYSIYYGRPNANSPQYDLKLFDDKLPQNLKELSLGPIVSLNKQGDDTMQYFFASKIVLWIIMVTVVLILGGFSLKMLRSN